MPLVWLRRAQRVLCGHGVDDGCTSTPTRRSAPPPGTGHLLAEARGQGFRQGFFDHSGHLWSAGGSLLASTQQIVYFKD